MKKIIALAVAGAFVAPVYAADVTIGGSVGYVIENADDTSTSIGNLDANNIKVTATDELANGMSVTGVFNIEDDQNTHTGDGSSLTISGDFGKLAMGDVAGAANAVGDYTDVAAWFGGFAGDGVDHAVSITPNLGVEGLTVMASWSPNTVTNISAGSGVHGDMTGFSAKYAIGAAEVYAAAETYRGEAEELDFSAYGVKYSVGGFTVAYETASEEAPVANVAAIWGNVAAASVTDGGEDVEYTGASITYGMGDITLAAENQKQEQGTTEIKDTTTMSATYAMGPLSVAVSISEEDVAATDSTALKFAYSF